VSAQDTEAIRRLKTAIRQGKNWYLALLEAIRLWTAPEEDFGGQRYQYLIDNEAFDWLVLAARLCEEVRPLIPQQEVIDLIFFDRPPLELSRHEFQNLIGAAKYKAYLNYLYGILLEKFLILAVTDEIRKKKRVLGLNNDNGVLDEAYQHIYGATESALLRQFRREKHRRHLRSISLTELNEFTYWLFKYRMRTRDKSCVASDTKKALAKLHRILQLKARTLPAARDPEPEH